MYATNVYRRDGDVLLRTNTLEDELHTRVPLLLKTKPFIIVLETLASTIRSDNDIPGGDSHMKQMGMLVGNFEFNP